MDFFKISTNIGKLAEFLIPANRVNGVKKNMADFNLNYNVVSDNVAR